ncbi:MAG TPA: response regulator [Patescibacteria group bacterium]
MNIKKKILIVDDDEQQRELYVDLFKDKGFEVASAEDGRQGLDMSLKAKPDLVFTGIIMPWMDGFEFIRNLRINPLTAEVPVIMFSHLGREEDREKAKKLSNVTFFVKGIDGPADILKKVQELVDGSK